MGLQDLTPQLRTRLRRVEKIVGFFITIATLVLLAGFAYYLWHTAARKGWFVEKCRYYTCAQSGEGLKVGDPVLLMGFNVGEVTRIETLKPTDYYSIQVDFDVRKPYYGYILSNSKALIRAAGFLGQRQIEITKGTWEEGAQETAYEDEAGHVRHILVGGKKVLLSENRAGVFVPPLEDPALTERAEKLVHQVELALPSILGMTNQLNAVLSNSAALTANLDRTITGTAPILSNATQLTANLNEITGHLRDPHGSLGEWLIPPNLQTQLTVTVANVNTNLLTLNQALLNVANITSNLNSQVQANDQILSELSRLVTETDDLVQGLKRHWLLKGAFEEPAKARQQLLEPEAE